MERGITYDEMELKWEIKKIYFKLNEVTTSLAMISQQLDGKRKNLDSNYIKEDVMKSINRIVEILNGFEVNSEKLPAFNLDITRKNLEEKAKEDIL